MFNGIPFFGMNQVISGGGTPPVADFVADAVLINTNEIVTFTDLSTNTPTSWAWDFGDGNTDTSQNPTHSYSTDGTYSVSMTASNAGGSDGEVKTDYIRAIEFDSTHLYNGGKFDNTADKNVLRKVTTGGSQVWEDNPFAGTNTNFGTLGIAVSRFNEVYATSRQYGTETYTAVKVDESDGSVIWGLDFNIQTYGCVVDYEENPWFSHTPGAGSTTLNKMDKDTGVITVTGGSGSSISVDLANDMDGNIYHAGTNTDYSLAKYDNSGNFLWGNTDHGLDLYNVAIPLSGTYVVASGLRSSNITWRKWDSDGNLEYSRDTGDAPYFAGRALWVDEGNDFIYVLNENEQLRKYNSDGTLVWSQTLPCSSCRANWVIADGVNNYLYIGEQTYDLRQYDDVNPVTVNWTLSTGDPLSSWVGALYPLPYGRNNIT
jgi:PKD repeat protein